MANKLINESSPYLLQHAHNPVDWYPWGEEALQKAREEDKPILVSIGYAACHWCHVMEKESFEDKDTAEIMNRHFVNIKIDREERPDLDHIYMDALQALSGSGGWPLNVFLTPEGKPFYGGTYFPPKDYYNRPSWKRVLESISRAYNDKKDEITQQAQGLTDYISNAGNFALPKEKIKFSIEAIYTVANNILEIADKVWGGYGKAPKFPQTFTITTLLRSYYFTGNKEALHSGLLSIDKMIAGGIYDHAGGGFSRYSTDEYWLAPHFEKMLYDNALLISALSEALMITKNSKYKKIIEQTIRFIKRELMHPKGAFYTALDADSEGVEGKFYTWSKEEIKEILKDDAEKFSAIFDIKENGNWEGTNILWRNKPAEEFAQQLYMHVDELEKFVDACLEKLMQVRDQRVRPALDDKVILSQNALMITALCNAYAATGTEEYLHTAMHNWHFLESNLFDKKKNGWYHTWKNNHAKIPAFLDDLACLIGAMIELHTATGNNEFIIKAKALTEYVVDNYSDEQQVLFYFTPSFQEDVIVRKKEIHDGATPSGNAVMAHNLLSLSVCFDNQEWKQRSENMLHSIAAAVIQHPVSFGVWSMLLQKFAAGMNEIVVSGKDAETVAKSVLQQYIPNKVLFSSHKRLEHLTLLQGKFDSIENTQIFVCKDYACKKPVDSISEMMTQIN